MLGIRRRSILDVNSNMSHSLQDRATGPKGHSVERKRFSVFVV